MSLASQLGQITGKVAMEKYAAPRNQMPQNWQAGLDQYDRYNSIFNPMDWFGGHDERAYQDQAMAQGRPLESYDRFDWYNTMDWFGGHEEDAYQRALGRQNAMQGVSNQYNINPQQLQNAMYQNFVMNQIAQQYPGFNFGQGGGMGGGMGGRNRRGNAWDFRQQKPKRSLKQRLARTNKRQERLQAQMDARNAKRNPPAAGSAGSAGAPAAKTPAAPTPPAATTPTPTTPTAPQQPAPSMVNPVPTGDLPSMHDQEMYELNRPDRQPTPAPGTGSELGVAPLPDQAAGWGSGTATPTPPTDTTTTDNNPAGYTPPALKPNVPQMTPQQRHQQQQLSRPENIRSYQPGGNLQSKVPSQDMIRRMKETEAKRIAANTGQPSSQTLPSPTGGLGSFAQGVLGKSPIAASPGSGLGAALTPTKSETDAKRTLGQLGQITGRR